MLQNYLDTQNEILFTRNSQKLLADGSNAAYCQRAYCVGFDSDDIWPDDFFNIIVTSNGQENQVRWGCISSLAFYRGGQQHRKLLFEKWLQEVQSLELLDSKSISDHKKINQRDDHGKDKLEAHAKRLCKHRNVDAILTSLPFNPHANHYVTDITDDGLEDVALWREEKACSMRVKTSGRNAAETKEIAHLLQKQNGTSKKF